MIYKKILCYYVIEIIKQKTEKGYKRENKSNLMHETNCWLLDLGVQKYSVILDLSTKIQQTKMLLTCQTFGDFFFIRTGLAVFYKSEPI